MPGLNLGARDVPTFLWAKRAPPANFSLWRDLTKLDTLPAFARDRSQFVGYVISSIFLISRRLPLPISALSQVSGRPELR